MKNKAPLSAGKGTELDLVSVDWKVQQMQWRDYKEYALLSRGGMTTIRTRGTEAPEHLHRFTNKDTKSARPDYMRYKKTRELYSRRCT